MRLFGAIPTAGLLFYERIMKLIILQLMILIFSVLIILINIRSTTPSHSGSSNPKLWQGFESGTDFSEKQKELDIKIKEAEMEREKKQKRS